MAMLHVKLILGTMLLFMIAEAGKKFCGKKALVFEKCIKKGYRAKIFKKCTTEPTAKAIKRKTAKICSKVEKKIAKKCKSFECDNTDDSTEDKTEWTPIFNSSSNIVGPFHSPNFPEFRLKFTQKKDLIKQDKGYYIGIDVNLYNGEGSRLGFTNFMLTANGNEEDEEVQFWAHKRFYFDGPPWDENSSCLLSLELNYLKDFNFEMVTSVGSEDMFQFTTPNGERYSEDMGDCISYSAWQEMLKDAQSAEMMILSWQKDLTDYFTTGYNVRELTDDSTEDKTEWTPIFNSTSNMVGRFHYPNFPEFRLKFTQHKELIKAWESCNLQVSVNLFSDKGTKLGYAHFIIYANLMAEEVKFTAYKRFYFDGPWSGTSSCSEYFELYYLKDFNFEMVTSVGSEDMFQFTTPNGERYSEDMGDCISFSAWQEMLKDAQSADMRIFAWQRDLTDYLTTGYNVREF